MSELLMGHASGDAQAIIDAAREILTPATLDTDVPQAFVLPEGVRVELPDLRCWRDMPTRKIGTYRPADVDSFIRYVKAHESGDHTTIWVDLAGAIVGLLNDNAPEAPGWGDHSAVLTLEQTPEWRYWLAQDKKMLSQGEFIEHIEGGLQEIVEPDGAEMLELAQNFHAASSATFRASVRLASGQQQLRYDEEVQASAGASGELVVPTMFLLAISPFTGEDAYRVAARLRFRITSGKLTLGYWLDRPERVQRDAIEAISERLAAQFANVYLGKPSGA